MALAQACQAHQLHGRLDFVFDNWQLLEFYIFILLFGLSELGHTLYRVCDSGLPIAKGIRERPA